MACIGLPILICTLSASAYDAETHALIAYEAYGRSTLSQRGVGSVVARLGLDRFDTPTPFNTYWVPYVGVVGPTEYYDTTGPSLSPGAYPRQPNEFERCQMQHLADYIIDPITKATWLSGDPMLSGNKVVFFPIENWLMRGDLREDDISPVGYFFAPDRCGKPEVDPWQPDALHGVRVVNHFYDPVQDKVLGLGCNLGPDGICHRSVDWALGFVNSFATPPVIDTNRGNHFSYEDARQNMWFALTRETGRSTPPYTAMARETDAVERLYRWATAFKSLGDAIHLLQDGAQPQHVRNDDHSPFTSGERQAYEGYTNARVIGSGLASINPYVTGFFKVTPNLLMVPLIVTGSYPVVNFATPQRFFTTRLGTDSTNPSSVNADSRFGLMDYTNRGFFTGGTLPGSANFVEPPAPTDPSYTSIQQPCSVAVSLAGAVTNLTCTHLMHAVPENVTPSYTDTLPSGFTQPPLLLESAWKQVVPGSLIQRPHNGYMVGLEEFQTMANLTIPRAIAYSAGVMNYFVRGQFTVTAPPNLVVGVLNQGAQHTMNAQGYPCVGIATNDGCPIFGFQTIRVNVQNTTRQITESGSGTVVPQAMSATTSGPLNSVNPPYLVAVARYHRNTCYTPTLTGERVQDHSGTIIAEPVCTGGETVRTPYQEISVSNSFSATAAQLAPNAAAFEVHFDFSADPIPVNATDLFIQVVYRGPMGDATLGQEQDAIAVGTLDVREPTFAAFWNNTDYWWSGNFNTWAIHNATNVNEGIESFWACSGFPLKLMFRYDGANGSPAMIDPVINGNSPGVVRLGMIFPPPTFTGQQKTVQGIPVAFAGFAKITPEQQGTPGQFLQANLENISATTLAAPTATCNTSLPATPEYWCFDPIQQRRGQLFGAVAVPLYLAPQGNASNATDVDSVPLPGFAGTTPLQSGIVRFDTDPTLASCPAQP